MSNLRLAVRMLSKTPLVSGVAIVSLGLGIGATAAIVSLFTQILVRPLPVPEPDRLVNLSAPGPKWGSQSSNQAGPSQVVFSYPMFRDLERVQEVFTGLAAHRLAGANIAFGGARLHGDLMIVSGSYFSTAGVRPALGRLIGPDDDQDPGGSPVAVLSHAFWRSAMAGDPGAIGRSITVNGAALTIVGVAPRGFAGTTIGTDPRLFIPLTLKSPVNPYGGRHTNRRSYYLYLFARLKPGISIAQARASLGAQYHAIVSDVEAPLQQGMSDETLAQFRTKPILVEPGRQGQSRIPERTRPALRLLVGISALVLLIACANIANLLLVRAAARTGEMAVRVSIGASRRQLVAQLLTESLALAVCGGALGLFVARGTLDLIASLLPPAAVAGLDWSIDRTGLAVSAALTIGSGLLFGLVPALQSTRPDVIAALKGHAGQLAGARRGARFRSSLATAQIALSMTLLIAAGLFTKSLFNISRTDLGMDLDHVVTFSVSPELNGYSPERSRELFARIEESLGALPAVAGVSAAQVALLAANNMWDSFAVEGFPATLDTNTDSRTNGVGPRYFATVGVPLLAGREFTIADALGSPNVAVVNEAFAKKFGLGLQAVGKRIGNRHGPLDTEIVGLVRDAKYSEVKTEAPPVVYRPYRQDTRPEAMTFLVRVSNEPEALIAAVPRVLASLDPNLPVEDLRTMPEQIQQNIYLDRLVFALSGVFAAVATLLAAIGLYGVLAYAVSRRTREIGLRMALGAGPARVVGMVMRQVGMMTAIGSAVGLTGAVWLGRVAQSMLFQMNGADPIVFAGAAAALALVALGAGFAPARRAAGVDPMQALRQD